MRIHDLAGKKVCILGFGREGKAMAEALEKYALGCEITIADKNEALPSTLYPLLTGPNYLKNLNGFDCIIKSPGIPPSSYSQLSIINSQFVTSTQIFLDTIADSGALVIGVTGSKGKSTTSSLIYEILKAAGKKVFLVGNIGEPAISHIADAKADTIFIMEMSSYQLMDLTVSPPIAVITAIFPEHLNYHGNFESYVEAKQNIVRYQKPSDVVFYDNLPGIFQMVQVSPALKKIGYGSEDTPVKISDSKLMGRHNEWNMGAASAVARHLGIGEDIIISALKNFRGLPHRLQNLGTHHGIVWIDDSISTTPESTIFGLESIMPGLGSLICGGLDRGNDFTELGRVIATIQNIRHVFLFPETGTKIRVSIERSLKKLFHTEAREPLELHDIRDMATAVALAKKLTPQGTICLLSPASASYNMFKNFEDRGEQFKQNIKG